MENNNNLCVTSGQVTICLLEEGISITIKSFSKVIGTKIIPYNEITKVKLGPKWFPNIRIMTKNDSNFFVEFGMAGGISFKHNLYGFYPWHFKQFENLANLIKQRIKN